MATITKRVWKNGKVTYRASVRIMRDGEMVFQKSKSFNRHALAKQWVLMIETEIQKPGVLKRAAMSGLLLKDLIQSYIDRMGSGFGRTKSSDLGVLLKSELANNSAFKLTSADIIEHIQFRRQTVSPSTANNDLVWLRAVWRHARVAMNVHVEESIVENAYAYCKSERLVSRPRRRNRRPSDGELKRLTAYFAGRKSTVPMKEIMWFAIYSSRRESEICRLLWKDNIDDEMTGLVRDAKHPRQKEGNHRRFKYTPEGWDLIGKLTRSDDQDRIFPFNPKTVGAYFTDACHVLEIEDLRFHDLRHEATSRLFEAGYHIVEVQQFTLHDDWNTLKRYTHLRPGDLKHR